MFTQVIDTDRFEVVVVSPRNHFLFTPMLPSTAVGTVEFRSVSKAVLAGSMRAVSRLLRQLQGALQPPAVERHQAAVLCRSSHRLSCMAGSFYCRVATVQQLFSVFVMARPAGLHACVGCCRSLLEPIRTSNPTAVYVEAACDSLDPDKKVCSAAGGGADMQHQQQQQYTQQVPAGPWRSCAPTGH